MFYNDRTLVKWVFVFVVKAYCMVLADRAVFLAESEDGCLVGQAVTEHKGSCSWVWSFVAGERIDFVETEVGVMNAKRVCELSCPVDTVDRLPYARSLSIVVHQLYQKFSLGNILATTAAPAQALCVLDRPEVGSHRKEYEVHPVSQGFAHIAGFRSHQELAVDCVVGRVNAQGNRSLESGIPQAAGEEAGKACLEKVIDVGPHPVYCSELCHEEACGRGAPV